MPIRDTAQRFFTQIRTRFGIVGSLFRFLGQNKMWWLMPIIVILLVFSMIMIFASSTPLGPFIYAIF